MIEDERDRQLDVLLDSLLSSYSAAQPRPGLERRIRRQIEARNAQWRRWTLGFAAVPVAVALVMFAQMHVVRLHRSRPVSSGNGVVSGPPEHSGAMFMLETKPPFPSPVVSQSVTSRHRPSVPAGHRELLLLEAVNSMPSADNLILEHEKLYLAPAPHPQPESVPAPPTSAPSLTIRELGVESIEIKELPTAQSADSKGNL
jgi:hypothetical protein